MWIKLTDLNGQTVIVSRDSIALLETARRDECDITLTGGRVVSVRQSLNEIMHSTGEPKEATALKRQTK
jgi:uncharacterized protein YlzI (FlbEa/FlbD family)